MDDGVYIYILGGDVGTFVVVENKAAGTGRQKFLCERTTKFATASASAEFEAANDEEFT